MEKEDVENAENFPASSQENNDRSVSLDQLKVKIEKLREKVALIKKLTSEFEES